MGSMTSVLTTALPAVLQVVEAVAAHRNDRAERLLTARQLEQTQKLQERQAENSAALQKEQLALSTAHTEEERKTALKRAMARQRTNFGSQGVGSGVGSGQAVLLGMFDESDAERERRAQMDDLRLRIVDEDLRQRRGTNILQRSQLAEKNKLDRLASELGYASRAVKIAGGLF